MTFSTSKRDYSSFSAAAKSRFRGMARELGYEQVSGILYVRECDGWYQMFGLQSSIRGNPFFYVNYGIATVDLCPVVDPRLVKDAGLLIANRLRTDQGETYPCGTRAEIEESAGIVLNQYLNTAIPWFDEVNSWNAIAREYLRRSSIEESRLGEHTYDYGEDMRAMTYGYLLLKCGRNDDALVWLREAERIKTLPVYITRDGRTVHEKDRFARLQEPESHEIEQLENVRRTIAQVSNGQ